MKILIILHPSHRKKTIQKGFLKRAYKNKCEKNIFTMLYKSQ